MILLNRPAHPGSTRVSHEAAGPPPRNQDSRDLPKPITLPLQCLTQSTLRGLERLRAHSRVLGRSSEAFHKPAEVGWRVLLHTLPDITLQRNPFYALHGVLLRGVLAIEVTADQFLQRIYQLGAQAPVHGHGGGDPVSARFRWKN